MPLRAPSPIYYPQVCGYRYFFRGKGLRFFFFNLQIEVEVKSVSSSWFCYLGGEDILTKRKYCFLVTCTFKYQTFHVTFLDRMVMCTSASGFTPWTCRVEHWWSDLLPPLFMLFKAFLARQHKVCLLSIPSSIHSPEKTPGFAL